MRDRIQIMTATYMNVRVSKDEARGIRGFFANLERDNIYLHNHTADGIDIYRYPLVQYKVINENPVVVAIEDGIPSIQPYLMKETQLKIGMRTYNDLMLDISLSQQWAGDSDRIEAYRFETPWLALNQKNYKIYIESSEQQKKQLINRILVGNILSFCKGIGITIENKLEVTHCLRPIAIFYKETKMIAFQGNFQVNCQIPKLCGIGKGTAKGFGVVVER